MKKIKKRGSGNWITYILVIGLLIIIWIIYSGLTPNREYSTVLCDNKGIGEEDKYAKIENENIVFNSDKCESDCIELCKKVKLDFKDIYQPRDTADCKDLSLGCGCRCK